MQQKIKKPTEPVVFPAAQEKKPQEEKPVERVPVFGLINDIDKAVKATKRRAYICFCGDWNCTTGEFIEIGPGDHRFQEGAGAPGGGWKDE